MAGHSKWSNIKHRKGVQDAKKAKIYTKVLKEVTVAVQQGGSDPNTNPRLRIAIKNAKGVNLPKENLIRAIKKASGKESREMTEIIYEGYGPAGVAIIIECMTDNLNRSASHVRAAFNKHGGNLGKSGSLTYLFDRKGRFIISEELIKAKEDFMLQMIESGAEEMLEESEYLCILAPMEKFGAIQTQLEQLQIEPEESMLCYIPSSTLGVSRSQAEQVNKLLASLETCEDVQEIYHNMENPL